MLLLRIAIGGDHVAMPQRSLRRGWHVRMPQRLSPGHVPLREASSTKSNSVLTGGGACGIAPLKDGTGVGSSGGWGPPASGRLIPDPCTAREGGRAHCMLTSRGQLIQRVQSAEHAEATEA